MQTVDLQPNQTTEPESYDYDVFLQGAGAAAPAVIQGKAVTVTRPAGAGAYLLTFNLSPGPTFLGGTPGFGDSVAAANVLGWSVAFGAFTKATSGAKATLAIAVGNAANAAADLAATSSLKLDLRFKMGKPKL